MSGDGWERWTRTGCRVVGRRGAEGDEGGTCYGSSLLRSAAGCLMGGWEHGRRRRSAVLPVAVGHGILSLLLLEELCDGQQLFQHVLHRERERKKNKTKRS